MSRQFNSLQALRAVAAMLVVAYHATKHFRESGASFLGDAFAFGYAGVDLFFVLSGFIIAHTAFRHVGNRAELVPFVRKRLVRVLPVYWLLLALPLVTAYALFPHHLPSPESFRPENLWKAVLLVLGHEPISQVTWTLGFELYFYALFASLILSRKLAVLVWGLLAACLLMAARALLGHAAPVETLLDHAIHPINLEFALGVAAYLVQDKLSVRQARALLGAGLAGFLIVGLPLEHLYPVAVSGLRFVAYGIPSFLLVLSLVRLEGSRVRRYPTGLIEVGNASYVLYLIHSPILSVVDRSFALRFAPPVATAITLVAIAGIVAMSVALHRKVELPLTGWLNVRLAGRTVRGPRPADARRPVLAARWTGNALPAPAEG